MIAKKKSYWVGLILSLFFFFAAPLFVPHMGYGYS